MCVTANSPSQNAPTLQVKTRQLSTFNSQLSTLRSALATLRYFEELSTLNSQLVSESSIRCRVARGANGDDIVGGGWVVCPLELQRKVALL